MKSVRSKIFCSLLAGFLCLSARAETFTFVDWNLQGLNSYQYLAQGQTYLGSWSIADDPNWSSSLDILSIQTDFWFADDGNDPDTTTHWVSTGYYKTYKKKGKTYKEWVETGGYNQTVNVPGNYEEVDIKVGDKWIAEDVEVDGTISHHTNLVTYDMLSYDLTSILSISADLSADGILNYRVKAVKGDTYLKETRLTVIAENDAFAVPDTGSTMLLLGTGLAGLFAVRRRRRR